MTVAESNRRTIARVLYAIAIMLIVIPLSDVLPMLWPLRPGAADWRFGVVGLLSGALMTPLLGAFLAVAAAAVLDQRRMLAVGAWLLFALVAVLAGLAVLFALDFLEIRIHVQERARPAVLVAAVKAISKMGVGGAVSLLLAFSARRMAQRLAHERAADDQAPGVLVRAAGH